jgi:PAS domain S-box-containing protein
MRGSRGQRNLGASLGERQDEAQAYAGPDHLPADDMAALLVESPETARRILGHLSAGLGYFDSAGNLVAANGELERLLGRRPERAADIAFRPLHAAGPGASARPIARALSGETIRGEELEVPLPDGSRRWVRVSALPVGRQSAGRESQESRNGQDSRDSRALDSRRDSDQGSDLRANPGSKMGPQQPASGGAVVLVLDMGEPRNLDVIATQVLAVIAHDLSNPLSALRMTAAMLTKSQEMPVARRMELAERMLGTIGRMEGLVSTLIEHAQADRGIELRLPREQVDLEQIFSWVKRDLDVLFPGREIEVERKGRLDGFWDGRRLARVMSNLVTNAVKHGSENHPVVLTFDGSREDVVCFSVHNEGEPISAELLPAVFQPFTVGAPQMEERRRSVGLGLFIVEHLVKAHGGKVSVTSSAEKGTTFTVTLPRR